MGDAGQNQTNGIWTVKIDLRWQERTYGLRGHHAPSLEKADERFVTEGDREAHPLPTFIVLPFICKALKGLLRKESLRTTLEMTVVEGSPQGKGEEVKE